MARRLTNRRSRVHIKDRINSTDIVRVIDTGEWLGYREALNANSEPVNRSIHAEKGRVEWGGLLNT